MQRHVTLLLLAMAASLLGLAMLLRTPVEAARTPRLPLEASENERIVPTTGEPDRLRSGDPRGPTVNDTEASPSRRIAVNSVANDAYHSAPREEWEITFRTVPYREGPLRLRAEPKHRPPAFAISSAVENSDLHVATLMLSRAEIRSATLLIATSEDAIEARDGRPVPMTRAATWALGSAPISSGRRDDRALTVTGLTVSLQEITALGKLTVMGGGRHAVDLLVWTSPENGFPIHTLVEKAACDRPLAFGAFAPSESWFADVSPGEQDLQSEGAAMGRTGTDLVLQLR